MVFVLYLYCIVFVLHCIDHGFLLAVSRDSVERAKSKSPFLLIMYLLYLLFNLKNARGHPGYIKNPQLPKEKGSLK